MSTAVRAPQPARWWFLVAFVQGGAILALELAAGRLLIPLFGQSLELWSIVITVTLGALALGYALGARLARRPAPRVLVWLFGLSAAACFAVALGGSLFIAPLSRVAGAGRIFEAACLALAPSLIALGAVSPVLVGLVAEPDRGAGVTAGRVFAVSTLGSLVAGPLTGVVLLPAIGVRAVFGLTGAVLVLVTLGMLPPRTRQIGLLLYLGVLLVTSGRVGGPIAGSGLVGILSRRPSAYGQVLTLELMGERRGGVGRRRVLLVDGHIQNAIDPETGAWPPGSYQQAIAALVPLERGDVAVVLGLGAGLLPMHWARQGVRVIAAEPNAAVVAAARNYFNLRPRMLDIRPIDGRQVVRNLAPPADVIVSDAFVGAGMPAHLFTREALDEAAAALHPDGIWIAWVLDVPGLENGCVWPRVAKTAAAVFPEVRVYWHVSDGSLAGYLVVGLLSPGRALGDAPGFRTVAPELVRRSTAGVRVQTDDRYDLDRFNGRLNALAQAQVRAHIAPDIDRWLID